jgi:phosphopantetheinyl transferase
VSAGASPAIGPGRAAGWEGPISVEGWQAALLDCRGRRVLGQGELHVWSADLESAPPAGALSSEELERARLVTRPQARRRWLAARVFLRTLLASYLQEDPRSLRFSVQGRGKPVLDERRGGGALHFNLSHSGPLGVCALTRMCAVGVDVQLIGRDVTVQRLGVRLLGATQAARLDRLGPAESRRQVLRAWAALEAEHKRTGLGLSGGGERLSGPRPWLAQLDLREAGAVAGARAVAGAGAVALARPPSALFLGSWSYFRLSDKFRAK